MNTPTGDAVRGGFRSPETRALLDAGRVRSVPADSNLCEEGRGTECFFLVTSGEFEIVKCIAGKSCVVSTFGPGSLLALMPALDGAPCAVSMRAAGDATVVEITRDCLLAMIVDDGKPAAKVANRLSLLAIRRLRGATAALSQALHSALTSPEKRGRIDPMRLARIQAGSYAWLED